MSLIASEYCNQLAQLIQSTVVTDRDGTDLVLDLAAHRAVELILATRLVHKKIIVVGNGGSAAIAAHLHNDLAKAVGAKALVCTEPSLLTALANDHGYETAYQRQVELWAEPGDLLIAISSSGSSRNILLAASTAQNRDMAVLTFSGFAPENALRRLGDLNFYVPNSQYGMVELAHSILAHFVTDSACAVLAREQAPAATQPQQGDTYEFQAQPDSFAHRRSGVRRRRFSA